MRVCLIGYYDEGQYGLRSLEAALDKAGHDVGLVILKGYSSMFDTPTAAEWDMLWAVVRDFKPDLIGVTVRSPFVWQANRITELLRPLGVQIIWGGFHVTVAPEKAIEKPDMILRGEADNSFPQLVDRLSSHASLDDVPGLWWKDNGAVHKNPLGPAVEDLDSLPPPLLSNENRWFIEKGKLHCIDPLLLHRPPLYPAMASRGCPQHCTYCANSALIALYGSSAKLIRMRAVGKIIEEVKRFRDFAGGLDHVAFMDEVFGYKPSWVEEFAEKWKKELNAPFTAEVHPSLVKEEQIAKLKGAGLRWLNMGIQSGSERVRKEVYERPVSNDRIIEAADILHKQGIAYRVELIFGNPKETVEDMKETLDLLLKLPRPYVMARYQLTYFPGTPITERFLKEGLITEKDVAGFSDEKSSSWSIKIDINDGHKPDYYFYLCLVLIADFRYFTSENWDISAHPQFYPPRFIRLLEKSSWLKRNPEKMATLTDNLGKFAHWSYYWTSYFPPLVSAKAKTAAKLLRAGDFKTFKSVLRKTARDVAIQLGLSSRAQEPSPTEGDSCAH